MTTPSRQQKSHLSIQESKAVIKPAAQANSKQKMDTAAKATPVKSPNETSTSKDDSLILAEADVLPDVSREPGFDGPQRVLMALSA